jgi:hypothetical protein
MENKNELKLFERFFYDFEEKIDYLSNQISEKAAELVGKIRYINKNKSAMTDHINLIRENMMKKLKKSLLVNLSKRNSNSKIINDNEEELCFRPSSRKLDAKLLIGKISMDVLFTLKYYKFTVKNFVHCEDFALMLNKLPEMKKKLHLQHFHEIFPVDNNKLIILLMDCFNNRLLMIDRLCWLIISEMKIEKERLNHFDFCKVSNGNLVIKYTNKSQSELDPNYSVYIYDLAVNFKLKYSKIFFDYEPENVFITNKHIITISHLPLTFRYYDLNLRCMLKKYCCDTFLFDEYYFTKITENYLTMVSYHDIQIDEIDDNNELSNIFSYNNEHSANQESESIYLSVELIKRDLKPFLIAITATEMNVFDVRIKQMIFKIVNREFILELNIINNRVYNEIADKSILKPFYEDDTFLLFYLNRFMLKIE